MIETGTGGTSATIVRSIRYRRYGTYAKVRYDIVMPTSSCIEGIGRPLAEPSFLPGVVDRHVRGSKPSIDRRHPQGTFVLLTEMVATTVRWSLCSTTVATTTSTPNATTTGGSAQGCNLNRPAETLVKFERSCHWRADSHCLGHRNLASMTAGAIGCRRLKRGVAQLGSALRSGRRGRGFKSRHPD